MLRWKVGRGNGALARYSRLGWLLCLVLVPGLVTGAVFIVFLQWQAYVDAEEETLNSARALAQVFDGVAEASLARLQALATSPLLADGDLAAFQRQATETSAAGKGGAIVLLDRDGRQLMNTLLPYGSPLPRGGVADALGPALAAGQPAVSPLFIGAVSKQPYVAVFLPLARYGRPGWGLVYGIPAAALDSYFSRQVSESGREAALVDRNGRVIAHSAGGAMRGREAAPEVRAAIGAASEGVFAARSLSGAPAQLAHHYSPTTGWTSITGVTEQSLMAGMAGRLAVAAAAIGVVLAAGVVAAWWLHREAVQALRGLQLAAEQAEQGIAGARAVVGGPREIARLALQFNRMQAAGEASKRGLELAASVFDATSEGILIVDADLRIIEANRAFQSMSGYGRNELLGRNPRMLQSGRHDDAFYQRMWAALNSTGNWDGQVWDRRRDGTLFAAYLSVSRVDSADGKVSHYVSLFTDITEQRMRQDEIEMLAFRDPLTHLPNRRLLHDRLSQAIVASKRTSAPLAVCSLDLDGFKAVNDEYGHEAGDEVLLAVAGRLQQSVRANDTVARLGGDEFVLLLADLHDMGEAEDVAARALLSICVPIPLSRGSPARVSASIGIAYYPGDAQDANELLRLSDAAMYEAKHRGRNQYVMHMRTV
ncbi:diguanylate cyclase [Duganella sp. FT92W]|uniref:Diguanylate cyclase n=1 Tax=Pseudoduganella rivuli TaxID=2666085 RepID=A0A7X2LU84_9BURK|nr:diguanylate cyclase [Pseudoduganella rivuli]MRV73698.1 diguanylate cyclase [Pseudoduganella rivuli]